MGNIIGRYFNHRILSRFYVFLFDVIITLFSVMFVFFLFYELVESQHPMLAVAIVTASVLILFNSVSFYIFKTYSGVLRFSVFSDLIRIVYALTAAYLASLSVLYVLNLGLVFLELIRLVTSIYFVNIFLMFFSRIIIKESFEMMSTTKNVGAKRVFIYGVQPSGLSLATSLRRNSDLNYKIAGFISNRDDLVGKKLLGLDVFAFDEALFDVLRKMNVQTVIVSPDKFKEDDIGQVLETFIDHDVSLLTTDSSFNEWNGKASDKRELKEVQIEDLLPRMPIKINMKAVASNLEGKRILITGAAGSIGSEIVRQIAAFNPYRITLIDQAETPLYEIHNEVKKKWRNINVNNAIADVGNESRMRRIFMDARPNYVFHAAAYKHVPMMEDNVSEAVQNNVLGTKVLADLAVEFGVDKFVMVSTDKAVNPSNVMGCSKRICEIYVQSLARHMEKEGGRTTQFITTRFGNVLGSNGSVIPLFREQIRRGGPVTVTHPEIIRYFMTIPEACQLVLEAGSMGKGGEIYLFDMGKPVKILDLAKRMIRLSGSTNVKIEFTGLRHGEKLYEELLNTEENTIKTHHEKIMIAQVQDYDYLEVDDKIKNLIQVSYRYDTLRTVKIMKEIVPEFKSLNSPYETVDRLIDQQKLSQHTAKPQLTDTRPPG